MVEFLCWTGLALASWWGALGETSTPMEAIQTPILPPIQARQTPVCEKRPTETEIMRALPPLAYGIPGIFSRSREDYEFKIEKLTDRIDAPRVFPLIGPAQLHHCHWKCTVTFTETIELTYPTEARYSKKQTEVIYIDKDHLHLYVVNEKDAASEESSAPTSRPSDLTIDDVVKMTKSGVSAKIILRQMEIADATFDLRAADIVHLRQQGVSNRLICAMQDRHSKLRKSETGFLDGKTIGAGMGIAAGFLPKNPAVNQISIDGIVQASQSFVADEIIIRQIESTKSIFNLTPEQIRYLEEQGVSPRVINSMGYPRPSGFSTFGSSLPFGGNGILR